MEARGGEEESAMGEGIRSRGFQSTAADARDTRRASDGTCNRMCAGERDPCSLPLLLSSSPSLAFLSASAPASTHSLLACALLLLLRENRLRKRERERNAAAHALDSPTAKQKQS